MPIGVNQGWKLDVPNNSDQYGNGERYGVSRTSRSVRTVRQFRMVLAVCNCEARYSFVSLLRATPFG